MFWEFLVSINDNWFFQLFYQSTNPGIKYEYKLPVSSQRSGNRSPPPLTPPRPGTPSGSRVTDNPLNPRVPGGPASRRPPPPAGTSNSHVQFLNPNIQGGLKLGYSLPAHLNVHSQNHHQSTQLEHPFLDNELYLPNSNLFRNSENSSFNHKPTYSLDHINEGSKNSNNIKLHEFTSRGTQLITKKNQHIFNLNNKHSSTFYQTEEPLKLHKLSREKLKLLYKKQKKLLNSLSNEIKPLHTSNTENSPYNHGFNYKKSSLNDLKNSDFQPNINPWNVRTHFHRNTNQPYDFNQVLSNNVVYRNKFFSNINQSNSQSGSNVEMKYHFKGKGML